MSVRGIVQLINRNTRKPHGQWDGTADMVTDDEIYEQYRANAVTTNGSALERENFNQFYEIVRFEEVMKH